MAVPRTSASEDSPLTARTPDWASAGPRHLQMAGPSADHALWDRVIRHARCADGSHDPDQWFPVSMEIEKARHEAAAAIAVCNSCPVRAQCLALSLRNWDIGQHGVWGGLVAAERAVLRRLMRAHMARRGQHGIAATMAAIEPHLIAGDRPARSPGSTTWPRPVPQPALEPC